MSVVNYNNIWLTYAVSPETSQALYDISSSTVNALTTTGPVCYLIIYPFASSSIDKLGLRKSMLIATGLMASGSILRSLCGGSAGTFWLVPLGQVLNSMSLPVVASLPSVVSSTWFPVKERTLASAIGSMTAACLGCALSFLIGMPVRTVTQLRFLLFIDALVAFLVFAACVAYFPNAPPTPPSLSASHNNNGNISNTSSNNTETSLSDTTLMTSSSLFRLMRRTQSGRYQFRILRKNIHTVMSNKDSAILLVSGAIYAGIIAAWAGLFVTILVGLGFSQTQAQWAGFVNNVVGMFSGVVAGYIHDKYYKKYKSFLIISYAVFCLKKKIFTLATRRSNSKLVTALVLISNDVVGLKTNVFYHTVI
eukprot:TRINITY_DN7382_c0_g1_i1.p1 TRINITY_DN7382_c0_g1~~TRINITY_DN7382_c0_g1_i1.p1  ORF type:complete len:424 (+),score=68.54 TRINITY_DN7382_c0_g1_i1:178-1272(+)